MATEAGGPVAWLARLRVRTEADPPPEPLPRSAPAFRAAVNERLRSLEQQVAEVKARVNGLLFLIAGTMATQVILRLFA